MIKKGYTIVALLLLICCRSVAQQFTVERFAILPNDISAYISPVYDLNGEACALLKVTAQDDFAFSTPLGIVKRKDEVGEIWLYLPRGTKLLTIKHPQWGVMRNYRFEKSLESRMTYELIITPPKQSVALKHDTIVLTTTRIDTVDVRRRRPQVARSTCAMLTVAFGKHGVSWGVMLATLRRHGVFLHTQTDFRSIGDTRMDCDKAGYVGGNDIKPYYTGDTRHSNFALMAGLIHRLGRKFCLFEGAGYGRSATAWRLAESEGGGYALNDGLTHKGFTAELGALLRIGALSVSASAITIKGELWQGCIGVGINICGKK